MTKHWIGLVGVLGCLAMAPEARADFMLVNYYSGSCLGVPSWNPNDVVVGNCNDSSLDTTWDQGAFWPSPYNMFSHILSSNNKCLGGTGVANTDNLNCSNTSSDPYTVGWWVDFYGAFSDVPGLEGTQYCYSLKSMIEDDDEGVPGPWLTEDLDVSLVRRIPEMPTDPDGYFKSQVWCVVVE